MGHRGLLVQHLDVAHVLLQGAFERCAPTEGASVVALDDQEASLCQSLGPQVACSVVASCFGEGYTPRQSSRETQPTSKTPPLRDNLNVRSSVDHDDGGVWPGAVQGDLWQVGSALQGCFLSPGTHRRHIEPVKHCTVGKGSADTGSQERATRGGYLGL